MEPVAWREEPLDPWEPGVVVVPWWAPGARLWDCVVDGSLPAPAAVSPQAARARHSAAAAGQRSHAAPALRVILIRLG